MDLVPQSFIEKFNSRKKSFGLRRVVSRQFDTHGLLISLTPTPLFGRVAKRRLCSQSPILWVLLSSFTDQAASIVSTYHIAVLPIAASKVLSTFFLNMGMLWLILLYEVFWRFKEVRILFYRNDNTKRRGMGLGENSVTKKKHNKEQIFLCELQSVAWIELSKTFYFFF